MRQLPTSSPLAHAAVAAFVTAAFVAAQSPATQSTGVRYLGDTDRPEIRRVDADTGEVLPRWTLPALDLTRWPTTATPTAAVQDDDDGYAVTRLFNDMHGEFLQKGFAFRNNLRLMYGYQTEAGVSDGTADVEFDDIRADVFVPMTLDPDMLLLIGGTAGVRRYDFASSAPGIRDEDVFEGAFHVGLGRFLTEDLYVEAVFRPGVYTDFDGGLHGDDWKFYGDVIGTYRFDPGFYGKIGAVYDGTFDDLPAYPVIGFALLLDESFRLDVLLPKSFEISWIPDASWILKAGVSLDGEEYHIRGPLDLAGNKPRYDVRTQELRLYVDGTMRLSDEFSLFGRVGSTLLGDYDWGAMNASIDPSMFVEVGAGINF